MRFPGAGAGQVDIFDTNGNFVSTFVAAGAKNNLNAPWGVVQAPASFGTFANDILVSNFGDGTISAFSSQGIFEGQLSDSSGNVLSTPACGIWCLAEVVVPITIQATLGTLYITAGGSAGQPNFPAGGSATAVFASLFCGRSRRSRFLSESLSRKRDGRSGGSANLMISAAAVGGFQQSDFSYMYRALWSDLFLSPQRSLPEALRPPP